MDKTLRLVVSGGPGSEAPDGSGAVPVVPGALVPEPEPVSEPEPPGGSGSGSGSGAPTVPDGAAGASAARGWLSAAAASRHLGGGPDGLAAHIANPSPEPLKTHLKHAGNAIRAAMDPENGNRTAAAAKAAYHILFAIPVKTLAKTIRHAADIADTMPDSPRAVILVIVVVAVIAAMIWPG